MKKISHLINFLKTTFKPLLAVTVLLLMASFQMNGQTVVNSLAALQPYLDDDNVNIKLAPGTYTITADNAGNYGMYEDHYRTVYTLFPFMGNNSTFDFTNVVINVETEVLSNFGNVDVYEIRIGGNNNVLKNLTLTDIGSVYDAPGRGANSIVMDGKNNVIDGFTVTAKGSSPYGYGDIFGKGGGAMVSLKKHSGILIRGDYNTLKNTTMIHRAFGHCVFFQAANHPTVDGCYIEGEMRSTDDILKEEGTGSTADDLDFMTIWGYKLPSGFMIALCEAGIRAYNAGETFIDGVSYSRGTNDVTVLNTVVKNTRTACTISQGSGYRYVENVTSIGNEFGFGIGSGDIVNCKADAAYGPIIDGASGIEGTITLIDPENGYYNGSKSIASVTGGTFTMYSAATDVPSDLAIRLGSHRSFRHQEGSNLMYQVTTDFSGGALYNHSNVAVDLGPGSDNVDIYTCGSVTDNGTSNSINYWDDCDTGQIVCGDFNAFAQIEAEDYCNEYGIQIASGNVGYIEDGDWIMFSDVDFENGVSSISASVSSGNSGGTIEIRLGNATGNLLGTLEVSNTGSWTSWETVTATISSVSGAQDIYLVFTGGSGYLLDINWFQFSNDNIGNDCDVPWSENTLTATQETLNYESESIDISCVSSATISMDISGVGPMETADYLNIYYSIDGGAQKILSENTNAFSQKTVSVSGISGNSIQLSISAKTSYGDETYTISNIKVTGSSQVASFSRIEAEDYDGMFGIQTEASSEGTDNVGWINNGDWLRFDAVDLTEAQSVDLRIACNFTGGTIEVRTGSTTGTLIGSTSVSNTGGNQEWITLSAAISDTAGVQDIYLVFNGGSGYLFNINWLEFSADSYSSKNLTPSNEALVYPTLVENVMTIEVATSQSYGVANIINIAGQVVASKNITGGVNTINLENLHAGMYIVNIKNMENNIVKKIVKK
ncbi:carbohydrate-binding protein [Aquimarina pacifica]|uniref:carbohydrate-binding protein n=1 Tax=Aquimarina pacifica TaxID=1296415 RepID=UPI00046FC3F4|nr:carbohydrate-binding protein [Aquimarina pacifica]